MGVMGEINRKDSRKILLYSYLVLFSIAGLALTSYLVFCYYQQLIASQTRLDDLRELVILIAICSICRSLPLPTRRGKGAMDISAIIVFASFLLEGANGTAVILLVSTLFTFVKWEDNKLRHIFNTPFSQTVFNNSILTVSMYAGALVYRLTVMLFRFYTQGLALPGIILPSFLFLIAYMLVNCLFMALLFRLLQGAPFIRSFTSGIVSMAPTLLAFTPIGIFLAKVFDIPNDGPYLALLFFIPLIFARYAFKLYLDSREQYLRTISTLTAAIEAKDEYTQGHSDRVAQYAVEIAQAMGLRSSRIENIKVAAVLHDIGKIGIDDEILRKPGKLTQAEWGRIEQHPSIGIKILEEVKMPDAVKEMIHYHHVRYDRKGYPKVGPETQIPLEVHIISLADAFDAMTSDRPYRKALSEETARNIIKEERGTQFQPDIVDVFLKMKNRIQAGDSK